MQMKLITTSLPNSIYLRSIVILSRSLGLDSPSGLFRADFPTKTLYAHLFSVDLVTPPKYLVAARSEAFVCGRSLAGIVGLYSVGTMDVCLLCMMCELLGRDFCDELITRPLESYRLLCPVVCDLELSSKRNPWPALGRSATGGGLFGEQCKAWSSSLWTVIESRVTFCLLGPNILGHPSALLCS